MVKILMVSSGFTYRTINYGGVNKMFLWLGNTLASEGYDVSFCCIHDIERSERIDSSVKSIELSVPTSTSFIKKHILFFYHATKLLKKILKDGQYDYVFNFDGMEFYVLLFLRRFFPFKFVVSERADPNYNHSFLARLKRWLFRYVDVLVCQTEGAKQCFNNRIQNKTVVIPNPIKLPKHVWDIKKTKREIAHVARLHIWQKRQDILLKAFALFHTNHPDFILNLYGGGQDEMKLRDLTAALKISSFVVFHGNTSEIGEKLLNNELFVLTSDFEGMPNALMEAMATGMPVISTKCSPGGAEALIRDGINGLLVECGDIQGLAAALSRMADNFQFEIQLANNARISMRDYSPEVIISMWEKILR